MKSGQVRITFDIWNERRRQINPSASIDDNFYISSRELTLLQAKLVLLDQERAKQVNEKKASTLILDYSNPTSQLYREHLVFVMKSLQQKIIDEVEILNMGRRLCWLIFIDPIHTMTELFKMLRKNSFMVDSFMNILTLCRPCFDLKIVDLSINADEDQNGEVLCVVYVLKKMLHQQLKEDASGLKEISTLLRQLSRTTGKPVITFEALVPATQIITDIIFSLPLNQITVDFILTLLNHIFGSIKDTHVFIINWKSEILPNEMFAYILFLHIFIKRVDSTRTYLIPYVFRSFGTKLKKDGVVIVNASVAKKLFFKLGWAERYVIYKALDTPGMREFSADIPACLYRYLRHECKKRYSQISNKTENPPPHILDFFDSLFELGILSLDVAKELLEDMSNPIFLFDSSAKQIRAVVTTLLIKQTEKTMTIENYRNLAQLLELCLHRFDWPLDLVREFDGNESTLIFAIALKYELLSVFGVAAIHSIQTGPKISSFVLATCFVTESNRIFSDLFTRFVSDQNIYRVGLATSTPIVKALKYICAQLLGLAEKFEEIPLLEGFIKRMKDFDKQLLSIESGRERE